MVQDEVKGSGSAHTFRASVAAGAVALLLLAIHAGTGNCEKSATVRYRWHDAFMLRPEATLVDTLQALSLSISKTADAPLPELCAVLGQIQEMRFLTREDLDAEAWDPEVLAIYDDVDDAVLMTLHLEDVSTRSTKFGLRPGAVVQVPALHLDTPLAHLDSPGRRRPEIRVGDRIACMLMSWPPYGNDAVARTGSVLLLPDSTSALSPSAAAEVDRLLSVYRRVALEGIGVE